MVHKAKKRSILKREFTLADGYDVLSNYHKKGFQNLYVSAPYYWGVANPKKLKIVTFAEGDIVTIKTKNKKEFKGSNVVIIICGGNISTDKLEDLW